MNVFLVLLQIENIFIKAIADTGAFSSAMSQKQFNKIKSITNMEINKKAQPDISVSTVFLQQSPILFIVKRKIKIGYTTLDEEFLIFENLSSTLLGQFRTS